VAKGKKNDDEQNRAKWLLASSERELAFAEFQHALILSGRRLLPGTVHELIYDSRRGRAEFVRQRDKALASSADVNG